MPRPPKTIVIPPKTIGERLRTVRLERGLSQGDLAAALGTKQSNISDIERGERGLTVQQLVKTCRTLKTTPNEVLGESRRGQSTGNGHVKDRRFAARLQQIDRLSKRDKQTLLRTIDTFLKGSTLR